MTLSLLFQGDSITDAGRDRALARPNEPSALGRGYAFLAACRLLAEQPARQLTIVNRGISGNRVPDLQARWREDCLALEPAVLSVLIGINDLWHKQNGRYAGSVADFENGYRELLAETRRALPGTRLILCEPFALRCGAVTERWYPELDQRRAVVPQLCQEVGAVFVPFQAVLDAALAEAPAEYWAPDGVHPSPAGHQKLADAWLKAAAPLLPPC